MTVSNPLSPPFDLWALTSGEEAIPRAYATAGAATSSQTLRLTYFTARRTEAITQVRVSSAGQAAAATPTLCRMGVYSEAANGDLTLVAAITSDTTLWAAVNSAYTRTLTSTFNKVAGQRYAAAVLVVTATTPPSFTGLSTADTTTFRLAPAIGGAVAGQSDLPATVANASIGLTGIIPQVIFLP
jgi:hypothetical protein